jgi:integrase
MIFPERHLEGFVKLTTANIRAIAPVPPKTDIIEFDDAVPGFGVRARAGGSKVYVVQYAIGEKTRRMSLGKVELQGVDKARDKAKDILAAVRLGQDPAGDKQRDRATATETFKAVADRFLAFQKAHGGSNGRGLRPRSFDDIERHILVHGKSLHGLLLGKVQRQDVANVITAVRAKGAAVTANRVRATLSSFFSWAISEGLAEHNPVTGTKRTEEQSRERVLSFDELRLIWNALEEDHFGAIIKLLLLTGQRAAEISGLKWSELKNEAFVLPPERTKNGREHTIPLSGAASAIIDAQPRRQGANGKLRDLIFGYADGPFSGWTGSRKLLNDRIEKGTGSPLPHWTPHDLRRSFATHASKLGIQPHIIEAILNHVSGFRAGVAGIYNRNPYDAEKRTALATWADHLLAIVEGRETNVTPMWRA